MFVKSSAFGGANGCPVFSVLFVYRRLAELVIAIVLHKPFCPILGQYEHLRGIARFSKKVSLLKAKDLRF